MVEKLRCQLSSIKNIEEYDFFMIFLPDVQSYYPTVPHYSEPVIFHLSMHFFMYVILKIDKQTNRT